MLRLIHLSEGLRYFRRSLKRKISGPKQYTGNARQICKSIIDDCWNGRYFRNSVGNYSEFWTRDFGFCVDALLKRGHKKRVLKTLEYALSHYVKHGGITAAISPKGSCFNFPDVYSPDSVAYFFRSLHVSGAKDLIRKNRDFLNKEIARFFREVINPKKGLVKRNKHFSGMRDYAVRDCSCYDTVMAAVLADSLKRIKILDNPLAKFDYRKIIKQNFWTGSYFLDDLSGRRIVTGDANIFPFLLGVFDDKQMLSSVLRVLQKKGMDKPLPLKYVSDGSSEKYIWLEFLVPGWERDCVWPHMGLLYVQLLAQVDTQKAAACRKAYERIILRDKTLFELYSSSLQPYKSLFYMADEGMLWCANFLA